MDIFWAFLVHYDLCQEMWGFRSSRENAKGPFLWSVRGLLFVNFKDNFTLFHWHVVCPTSPNQLDCIKCSKPFIFPIMTVTKGSVWAFETAFYLQSTPSQHLGQWSGERGFSTDCALCLILLSPFLTRESNRTLNLVSMSECWECAGVQLMKKSSLAHDFPWSDLPQQLSFRLFVS